MDKLVCLDPGHAYKTPGKRSFDGSLREYEFNRDVAKRTRIYLEKSGIHVIYSLDLDNPVDKKLEDRCALANIANADLFVSIHANAFGISIPDRSLRAFHEYANEALKDYDFGENSYDVNFSRNANAVDLSELIIELGEAGIDGIWG